MPTETQTHSHIKETARPRGRDEEGEREKEGDKRQMKGENADGEETGRVNENASLGSVETFAKRQPEDGRALWKWKLIVPLPRVCSYSKNHTSSLSGQKSAHRSEDVW